MRKFLHSFGFRIVHFFEEFGQIAMLMWNIFRSLRHIWSRRGLVLKQMEHIGADSLPLVLIIGLFTGMVAAWQAAYQFKGFLPFSYIGGAVSRAIFIELGPVLTAIVIAGRIGASIAAELGTMKVTEQIDALETLAINPVRYLVMPRVVSASLMVPLLVVFANTIALLGAFLVCSFFLGISRQTFFQSIQWFFVTKDITGGMLKSLVFGMTTALLGCHIGFGTEGGAEGVGLATIRAFVLSSSMILILDYALWTLIY